MSNQNQSLSLANPDTSVLTTNQKISLGLGFSGFLILILALFNLHISNLKLLLTLALGLIAIGVIWYSRNVYLTKDKGIKNDGVWFSSIASRGTLGWLAGIFLTGFYVVLYFYPTLLGLGIDGKSNTGLIALFDPLSNLLSGRPASQWFVYGTLYTLAIIIFGYKFILKYRHNKYQQLRTLSVIFFQLGFAFLIPEFMYVLNSDLPYYDLKNMWPLNYYNFEQYRIDSFINNGTIGIGLLLFGILSIFVISPFLTYKYGKRWYCSWVCGCGGLAETAGDAFRQLSDKSIFAWRVERWVIHSVLVFSVLMTTAVVYTYLGYDPNKYWLTQSVLLWLVIGFLTLVFALVFTLKRQELGKDARYGAIAYLAIIIGLVLIHQFSKSSLFIFEAETLRKTYGFLIGSIFSGVIGTGFYPILGNRVWCRFGCPMAAILGFQQRLFSKFRITTNGGQCISCGNCSTYCEMGIDVRSYAQKGENIVRSSCVGCGVCSAVCPRGVLKLENDSLEGRINPTEVLLGNDVDLIKLMNQK